VSAAEDVSKESGQDSGCTTCKVGEVQEVGQEGRPMNHESAVMASSD